MSEVERYPPGAFCFFELVTPEPAVSHAYYGKLFQWDFWDDDIDGLTYTHCIRGDHGIAAMYAAEDDDPPRWLSYINCKKVDLVFEKAVSLGATVLAEPFDVPRTARIAIIRDPQGAEIGLWQAKGEVGASTFRHYGAWAWSELDTPDIAASRDFYQRVIGWNRLESDPDGPHLVQRGIGVVAGLRDSGGAPAAWRPYFAMRALPDDLLGSAWALPDVGTMIRTTDPHGLDLGLAHLPQPQREPSKARRRRKKK